MRKLLLLFAFSAMAFAQRIPQINTYNGDPTGNACTVPNSILQSTTTGGFYSCISGHYVASSSSTGTVNPGQLALPKYPSSTGSTLNPSNFTYDAATGNNLTIPGTSFSNSVISGAVNTVLDLKARFGASGSNQTMTCTATATNTSLTSCTGGDFVVGSNVWIQSAGSVPSVATPSGVTATCGSDHGGSCSGSVVYGYEIVAVQGRPNGSMTAASTAVTVTQAAQSQQSQQGSSAPDVYTTVAWSTESNVSAWLVYKSINGGPYNFYTITNSSSITIKDFGFQSSTQFTCVDIVVPCTAPSAPVPYDIFAQVSAVSGGTYTLVAQTNQPVWVTGQGLTGTMPFTPGTSGTFTVQHDDTPALTAMYLFLRGNNSTGQVQVHIPAGNYLIHSVNPSGNSAFAVNISGFYNVTLEGDGYNSYVYQYNDRAQNLSNFLQGQCSGANVAGCKGAFTGNQGHGYILSDPAIAGTTIVTTATPSDAANFSAGMYVTIFDNASTYPGNFYAEVNQVLSADSTTGKITLADPTTKYYSTSLVAPYSNCTVCPATPMIYPITNGPTAINLRIRNFRFRGHTLFLNYNGVYGLTIENMNIVSSAFAETGTSRHVLIQNNPLIQEDGYSSSSPSTPIMTAAAATDYTMQGTNYVASHFTPNGTQICSEGGANVTLKNNNMLFTGIGDFLNTPTGGIVTSPFYLADTCTNFHMTANNISFINTNTNSIVRIDATAISANISGNGFFVDSAASTTPATTPTLVTPTVNPFVHIYDNDWKVPSQTGGGSAVTGNSLTLGGLSTFSLTGQSGAVFLYPYLGSSSILSVALTGNVTSVNLGSNRTQGLNFYLAFTQDATGSRTLPATCGNTGWITGAGIDCPNGAPVLNPAASSTTLIWFYDDGTTVHLVTSSYGGGLSSPLTTKGDLWGWSTTNARIPAGTNGTVLTADSTQTLGVKWASAPTGIAPGSGLVEQIYPTSNTTGMAFLTHCGTSGAIQAGGNGAPSALQSTSATSVGSCAGWYSPQPEFYTGRSPSVTTGLYMPVSGDWTSNRRIWWGLIGSGCSQATFIASDTPACSYVAIRYSTTASDTTFECVSDTGSGTPTVTAIGALAPSTAFLVVNIAISGSTATCTINGTVATNSSKVPTSTPLYDLWNNVTTTGSVTATHLSLTWIYGISTNGNW